MVKFCFQINHKLTTMKGLVLSGAGGAIGFLTGALSVVQKEIEHDKVVGVSSGALTGIMYACKRMDRMQDLLFTIKDHDVAEKRLKKYIQRLLFHLIGIARPIKGIYDNKPLRNLLRQELVGQTVFIDYTCVSVNIHTGGEIWWQIPKGTTFADADVDSFVSMIISSTAIPGMFPPEKIGGKYYADGGIKTHTPIQPTKQLLPEADHLTIISTGARQRREIGSIRSDLDYLPEVLSDLIGMVPEKDFSEFQYRNELARRGHPDYRYFPSLIVKPAQILAPTGRFHHQFMQEDWWHGVEQAQKVLGVSA
jgi:predicted acylesterase/phospholipase RssA